MGNQQAVLGQQSLHVVSLILALDKLGSFYLLHFAFVLLPLEVEVGSVASKVGPLVFPNASFFLTHKYRKLKINTYTIYNWNQFFNNKLFFLIKISIVILWQINGCNGQMNGLLLLIYTVEYDIVNVSLRRRTWWMHPSGGRRLGLRSGLRPPLRPSRRPP